MKLRDLLRESVEQNTFSLSAKEAQQVMGVDAAHFQQWLARGLIPSKAVKAGKRTWRRFHVRDVPRLILISELVKQGLAIGDVAGSVDVILNWKYEEDAVPGPILWFRQIHLIVFATAVYSLPEILRKHNCASCILLSFDELKRKVDGALGAIKKSRQEASS